MHSLEPQADHETPAQAGGSGQLGLGDCADQWLPQELAVDKILPRSVVTGGCHSAGLDDAGNLYMWGENASAQLARDPTQTEMHICTPTSALPLPSQRAKIVNVASGWAHTVVVVTAGTEDKESTWQLVSFGADRDHRLGRETTPSQPAHIGAVIPLDPSCYTPAVVRSVACGWKHSLIALSDGSVLSWGIGRHGELGLGSERLHAERPMRVDMTTTNEPVCVDRVYCGWQHSLFHDSATGRIFACGSNRHGQLGLGSSTSHVFSPLQVQTADSKPVIAQELRVGWHFAVCLAGDGSILAWGKGSHGQLALGSLQSCAIPVRVAFDQPVQSIACGSEHTLVVTVDGALYSCGWGEHGNLGHGDLANRSELTRVEFFVDKHMVVEQIVAAGAVSIAVVT